LIPLPERFCNSDANPTFDTNHITVNNGDGKEDEEEENDLLDEGDHEYDRGGSADAEDGPDWMFEAEEVTSKDPNYVFCPAPH